MRFLALLAFAIVLVAARPNLHDKDITIEMLDIGLASLIEAPVIHHDEVFSRAIRIIHDYERAPSCHRVATKALLDSCQSLEPAAHSANHALDLVKSAFAARLAICELDSAGAAVPAECLVMMPRSSENQSLLCRSTGYHCDTHGLEDRGHYQPTSQQQNCNCLKALESKPQWWTSYSNARQNAVLMCHAAREQIEHDQLLNTHRAMTDNAEHLSAALARSATEAASYLQQQKAFADVIKNFQAQLVTDLEQERRGARSIFSTLAHEVQAEYHNIFDKMFGTANEMAHKVDDINQDLSRTSKETKHVRDDLHELFQVMTTRHVDLAATHRASWESTQGLSVDVEQSLMRNKVAMDQIMGVILEFRNDMNNIYEVMSSMNSHQTALRDRAEGLTTAFNNVQEQVQGLQAGITEFATTQNETMSGFKVEMEAARALATAFSESISSLNIIGISTILDYFWTLCQGFGVVVVVFLVNWLAGKTAARIVAITCFGLITVNLASRLDMNVIFEASLAIVFGTALPYGLVFLGVLGFYAAIQYCHKPLTKAGRHRDRSTSLRSTSDSQHQPREDYIEIKKEPLDLEA